MHEGAAGRAAGLPAPGEIHAVDDGGRDRVEIGVRESDQRILAAELERHRLERIGGGLHHRAAGRHAADERDLGDIGMARQHLPDLLAARHQIPHSGRKDAVDQFGKPERGQRRLFGRLDHDGVAGGERGGRFSRDEHEGMIERDDTADHAKRLAHREIDRVRPHRDRGALHFGDQAGVEIELRGAHLGIAHHLGVRIAAIGGVDHGELVAILAQHVGDGAQHLGAFERRQAPPFGKGSFGGGDGGLRVGRRAVDHLTQRLACSRADAVDVTRRFRLLPPAGVIGVAVGREIGNKRLSLRRRCNCNHWIPPSRE